MSPDAVLALIRFVHFGGVLLLAGTVAFRRRIAVPEVAVAISGRLTCWERWAVAVALASAVAWLLAETAIASDGWISATEPATVLSLITDTSFGWVWSARMALAAGLVLAAWRGPDMALETGAMLLAFSLGWVGHGAMMAGAGGLLLSGGLGLHVLAAGYWAGALPALAVCLRRGGASYSIEATAASVRRFSRRATSPWRWWSRAAC